MAKVTARGLPKLAVLVVLSVLATACVSYPDEVKVPENTPLASFEAVNGQEAAVAETRARWSGVIAEIKNLKDKTRLEVLYYPARDNGRPMVKDKPLGRFRVYSDTFLDPAVFQQGKAITALGDLTSKESAKIGDYEYLYPTMDSAIVYLWPKEHPAPKVSFYYGWHGYHPAWYYRGGVRYIYVKGKTPAPVNTPAGKKTKGNP